MGNICGKKQKDINEKITEEKITEMINNEMIIEKKNNELILSKIQCIYDIINKPSELNNISETICEKLIPFLKNDTKNNQEILHEGNIISIKEEYLENLKDKLVIEKLEGEIEVLKKEVDNLKNSQIIQIVSIKDKKNKVTDIIKHKKNLTLNQIDNAINNSVNIMLKLMIDFIKKSYTISDDNLEKIKDLYSMIFMNIFSVSNTDCETNFERFKKLCKENIDNNVIHKEMINTSNNFHSSTEGKLLKTKIQNKLNKIIIKENMVYIFKNGIKIGTLRTIPIPSHNINDEIDYLKFYNTLAFKENGDIYTADKVSLHEHTYSIDNSEVNEVKLKIKKIKANRNEAKIICDLYNIPFYYGK